MHDNDFIDPNLFGKPFAWHLTNEGHEMIFDTPVNKIPLDAATRIIYELRRTVAKMSQVNAPQQPHPCEGAF